MISHFFSSSLRRLFALGVVSIACSAAYADQIAVDDFSGVTGSNPERELEINATGIPANNWKWSNEATYLEDSSIISAITGQPAGGKIRIKPPVAPVEVAGFFEINTGISEPDASFVPVQWVAVALSEDISENWVGGTQNLVWAIVRPSGKWTLFQNGTRLVLADSGDNGLAPFETGAVVKVAVQYDPESAKAALLIDGVNVSGWKQTSVGDGEIGAAGVLIFPEKETNPRAAKINGFDLSTVSLKETGK